MDFVTVSHSSLLEVAIHAPTSVASNIANAMANGHTTGVVRVRSLTVVVMRHCFDDLAETESAKVCEAFTATYVPLISSAMSLRFFSSILEMPGSPVSGRAPSGPWVLESPALTPSAMTGILPPSSSRRPR